MMADNSVFGICFVLTMLTFIYSGNSFDINDPKTNLESLVRVSGSKDSDISTVGYFNGSVYLRLAGSRARKIFYFEGFNVNRKLLQRDGSYASLSREIAVYRHPITSEIMQVWINPLTDKPNEVFIVQNDPVNGNFLLGQIVPTVPASSEKIAFELNVDLSYPNVLDRKKYPAFSAGDIYNTSELFTYFTNYTVLSTTKSDSVPYTGTWQRFGQFLPWMELGETPGKLVYNTVFYKCYKQGTGCIAEDIIALLNSKGLRKYLNAPVLYEYPNDTTWSVFKRIIDARRKANMSDIIIPKVDVKSNVTDKLPEVDARVVSLLTEFDPIPFRFNGSVLSQVNGLQSDFYRLEGNGSVVIKFNESAALDEIYMTTTIKYSGYYRNITTGEVINTWVNPFTNKTINLPDIDGSTTVFFERNDVYTNFINEENVIALLGLSSTTGGQSSPEVEEWSVNMPVIYFPLQKNTTGYPPFYGTWTTLSNFPKWMNKGPTDGHLDTKLIVYLQTN